MKLQEMILQKLLQVFFVLALNFRMLQTKTYIRGSNKSILKKHKQLNLQSKFSFFKYITRKKPVLIYVEIKSHTYKRRCYSNNNPCNNYTSFFIVDYWKLRVALNTKS